MAKPTSAYFKALEEAKQHHATSKTYSGKFLRPHAPFIKAIIDRLGCRSVLDYGCGKGRQYEWVSHGGDASIPLGMTIEQYWGVPVTKFDPAYPPFADQPVGKFDLVICTHVLGSVPVADLPWLTGELYRYAGKAIYVAEKLGEVRKQVFSGSETFPRGYTSEDWAAALKRNANVEVTLCTNVRDERGSIMTRQVL